MTGILLRIASLDHLFPHSHCPGAAAGRTFMQPRSLTPAAFIVLLALGCLSARAADHTDDTLDKVRRNIEAKKAVLIDVREKREWDAGHLESAQLAPLSQLADTAGRDRLIKTFPKDRVLYLHCKAGGRCLIAADLLKDAGFEVRPLKQGYRDLLKAGFEKAE